MQQQEKTSDFIRISQENYFLNNSLPTTIQLMIGGIFGFSEENKSAALVFVLFTLLIYHITSKNERGHF